MPIQISIRLKCGIHTIFLFANPIDPFSSITSELFSILRSRFPSGLVSSTDPAIQKTTPIPSADDEDDYRIDYAKMSNPAAKEAGWTDLEVGDGSTYTPAMKGIDNGAILAFMIRGRGDAKGRFVVEWPQFGEVDEADLEDGGVEGDEELEDRDEDELAME